MCNSECTDECAHPNLDNQVLQPGETIIDSTNSCITYTCPESFIEKCNFVEVIEQSCPAVSCPDNRYRIHINDSTIDDCCPDYQCCK